MSDKRVKIISLLLTSCMLLFTQVAKSTIDSYQFEDPEMEARFQQLIFELRCPKCQNQNLADSNSALSMDLKSIVYEKLISGETDEQIKSFMKQRYGDFILFDPEMNRDNAILWFGPIVFLCLILIIFIRWYIRNRVNNND
ncbi:MAG: cytochrome c-type biogenesis protein CcmH [Kangiellaceae bacterium]|nr:cytochrome c-type biogenesis protein CcmH [Kangiellaceae bacterium]